MTKVLYIFSVLMALPPVTEWGVRTLVWFMFNAVFVIIELILNIWISSYQGYLVIKLSELSSSQFRWIIRLSVLNLVHVRF